MTKFLKGLLIAASMIFANWQTEGSLSFSIVLVAIAFLLGYYAKNWWFPSVSDDGVLDWRDWVSAVLIGLSAAIPEYISQIIVDGAIVWRELLTVVGTVLFTYITSTFTQKAKN
jgi:hypothetical protein